MVNITLPDGSVREFDGPVSGEELAASISKSLAKAAVAVRVDGKLKDIYLPIEQDATVEIVTRDSEDGVELLRHDCAHVMAEAVKELYPDTQVTIGPTIDNGFYYDFSREERFTPEDLEKIEARMREIVQRDEPIRREVWDRNEAVEFFEGMGEKYKAEIIASIPEDEEVGLYRQGEFIDLCRGPHLPSTGKLGTSFKLMSVAGAYWRGDSRNEMLQRIYGTAWASDKELKAYLQMLEEAERSGTTAGSAARWTLFHMQEEGPGSVFWHPKGWTLFQGHDRLHARETASGRIPGDQHPGGARQIPVGEVRPPREVRREHVSHPDTGRAGVRAQADELPRPRAGVQAGHQELPGPAVLPGRVRQGAPLRAVRRAARRDARARVRAGRRPHLLHRGADRRGVREGVPADLRDLPRLRLRRRAGEVLRPAGAPGRL